MEKVVVTGATSMIGVALIRCLLKHDEVIKIYAVMRPSNSNHWDASKRDRIPIHQKIIPIECELDDYEKLPELIGEKCDIFYHLAWPRTATYEEDLADVLLKCDAMKAVAWAVDAARQLSCKKFVGAGSQSEYGVPDDGTYKTEMICNPVRVDGILHFSAGYLARLLCEQYDMYCIWMRIFSVYGVGDRKNSMISSTIDKLIDGEHCSFTKSEQTWDYVNADDIAGAFYLVGKKTEKSEVYNAAYGQSRPLKDYIKEIRDTVAPEAKLGIGEIPYPANPIMKMEVDVTKLKEDTGWKPSVSFKDGIRQIYDTKMKSISEEE